MQRLLPVPQADATIKVGYNWKDPVTSRTPAHSGTRVMSMLYTGTKGSSCVTIRVWHCEFIGNCMRSK